MLSLTPSSIGPVKALVLDLDAHKVESLLQPMIERPVGSVGIRDRLETRGDRVTDLHLWQVGPGHRAAVISVISDHPLPSGTYKRRLGGLRGVLHEAPRGATAPA